MKTRLTDKNKIKNNICVLRLKSDFVVFGEKKKGEKSIEDC